MGYRSSHLTQAMTLGSTLDLAKLPSLPVPHPLHHVTGLYYEQIFLVPLFMALPLCKLRNVFVHFIINVMAILPHHSPTPHIHELSFSLLPKIMIPTPLLSSHLLTKFPPHTLQLLPRKHQLTLSWQVKHLLPYLILSFKKANSRI